MNGFQVMCRADDSSDGDAGAIVLATRRVFDSRESAEKYAATVAPSREPSVVEL